MSSEPVVTKLLLIILFGGAIVALGGYELLKLHRGDPKYGEQYYTSLVRELRGDIDVEERSLIAAEADPRERSRRQEEYQYGKPLVHRLAERVMGSEEK